MNPDELRHRDNVIYSHLLNWDWNKDKTPGNFQNLN